MSKQQTSETVAAAAWMKSFFDSHAQHYSNTDRRYISLESFPTRTAIYGVYTAEKTAAGRLCVGYADFCKLWRRDFSRVDFPKCDACEECSEAISCCINSRQENTGARALMTRLENHLGQVTKDRFVYQSNRCDPATVDLVPPSCPASLAMNRCLCKYIVACNINHKDHGLFSDPYCAGRLIIMLIVDSDWCRP